MKWNKYLLLVLLFSIAVLLYLPQVFSQVTYSGVAFQETGLPVGTAWNVIVNGTLYNSTSNFISITLPPGTYNYSIPDIAGYTASPQSGNVTAILDPIKLNTITFSSTIPEFIVNSTILFFDILLALGALFALAILKGNKAPKGQSNH